MSKHTTLDQLKMLALRTKGEINKVDTRVTELSGRVDELVTAGGEPNVLVGVKVNGTALAIAEKMVDILIATGATNGTLAVNGVNVAVKGLAALAYKAQVSESDLDTALKAVLDAKASGADLATLIGEDTGKSARTIANEELTKQLIPESAKDSLDTLTEIAQWIQDHPDDASAASWPVSAGTAIPMPPSSPPSTARLPRRSTASRSPPTPRWRICWTRSSARPRMPRAARKAPNLPEEGDGAACPPLYFFSKGAPIWQRTTNSPAWGSCGN